MNVERDQAEGLRSLLQRNSLRVALFVSGVRRAGKSTAVANLALAGAQQGKNVMLIDEARNGASAIADCFGIRIRHDLLDALTGECSMDDVIVRGPEGVGVLPLGRVPAAEAGALHGGMWSLNSTFERFAHEMDWLLIDATAGFDTRLLPLALSASEVIVVTSGDQNGLTGSYTMMKLLRHEFGISRFRTLATRSRDHATTEQVFQRLRAVAKRHLGAQVDLLGSVPYDNEVKRAAATARPLISAYPGAASTRALRACAEKLLGTGGAQAEADSVGIFLKRLIDGSRVDFAAVAA